MHPFRSILEMPGLRACMQSPPHAAVRQLLRRSEAQNDRQGMCDQWLKHQFARRCAEATATACAACRECSLFRSEFRIVGELFYYPQGASERLRGRGGAENDPEHVTKRTGAAIGSQWTWFWVVSAAGPDENRAVRFVTEL